MITRRRLLQLSAGSALVLPFSGFARRTASAQDGPSFRFGVVADPQYAPVAPRGTRFYGNSLWKVSEAVEAFNAEDLEFVVTLGDIIDRHWESYDHILPIYDRLNHPYFFLLGNHDFEVGADYLHAVIRRAGLERSYYDFTGGDYRFVVLDGNEVSLFANPEDSPKHRLAAGTLARLEAAGAANAKTWNGGMSEEQFSWLTATLSAAESAGEKVVIFGHYPVYPANEHNMWESERFVDLVSGYGNVVAYFDGHNHAGNYGEVGGKHFVNLKGMVETADTTAYSIVEVYGDRLEIKGFGREADRTLPI